MLPGERTSLDIKFHQPIAIGGPSIDGLYTGGSHGCVQWVNRQVGCWGSNYQGQLGVLEPTFRSEPLPLLTADRRDVTGIALGASHSCLLYEDGRVTCFGYNEDGMLGPIQEGSDLSPCDIIGSMAPGANCAFHPVMLNLPAHVAAISAGNQSTCVVTVDHEVWCWGNNTTSGGEFTELGKLESDRRVPLFRVSSEPATDVRVGRQFACILDTHHHVACWGSNRAGQLGTELEIGSSFAMPLATRESVVEISASRSSNHACAVLQDQTVVCWGANDHGQLGNSSDGQCRYLSDEASSICLSDISTWIDLPHMHPCSKHPIPVVGMAGVRHVVVGGDSTCAVTSDGAVWCWGRNDRGQLGDGTTTDRAHPVRVRF